MSLDLRCRSWPLIAVGALLYALAFPPFGFVLPSFVSLVPLVWLLEDAVDRPRSRASAPVAGFWYGVVTNALILYWIAIALGHFSRLAIPVFLACLALLGAWWAIFAWAVTRCWRRFPGVPRWLVFASAWVAMEWGMGHAGDLAFPWLGLGTSLTRVPLLVQWADIGGTSGVAFWLAASNVLLAKILIRPRASYPQLLAVLTSVLLALGYGLYRETTLESRFLGGVALIQPNIGYSTKWKPGERDRIVGELEAETRAAIATIQPNLVLWPEAAVPGDLPDTSVWIPRLDSLARWSGAPLVIGGLESVPGSRDALRHNAAWMFSGDGRAELLYRKQHLVPVVERVPFLPEAWLRPLGLFGTIVPGVGQRIARVKMGRFGVVICFESAFSGVARDYRRDGADFLVNLTNDAWYDRTAGPEQHAAHLVMRAIETRMGIVRVANSGVSEIVSPLGVPVASLPLRTRGSLVTALTTSDLMPLYVRWGDWVGLVSVLLSVGLLLAGTGGPRPASGLPRAGDLEHLRIDEERK